jgi:hypothetical protein
MTILTESLASPAKSYTPEGRPIFICDLVFLRVRARQFLDLHVLETTFRSFRLSAFQPDRSSPVYRLLWPLTVTAPAGPPASTWPSDDLPRPQYGASRTRQVAEAQNCASARIHYVNCEAHSRTMRAIST